MPVSMERLARALEPRTVAVVGDKGASGYMWLQNMSGVTGKVYSVQVDPREIPGIEALGITNFTSLTAIPEDVDYVLCAVPRQIAPRVMQDAAAKGVAGVGMFTSGFAETGEELGKQLQDAVVGIARESGIALIGPNCMGLYNPGAGVKFSADLPTGESGPIGIISQSGTHGINMSLLAAANGLKVSKAISIGNAVVVDVPDYLDYFAQDDATEVVAMYVEGPRDGRRFVQSLRALAKKKPVVIWKGGQTDAGARATMSHTASLAAPLPIWNALVRQAGAIATDNLDETIDVLQVLLRTKPGGGTGVALLAQTGGQSVALTDAFVKAGLEVPPLSQGSYEQLSAFFNVVGGSYQNPFDIAGTLGQDQANLDRVFEIVDADPHIDATVMELSALFMARRWAAHPEQLEAMIDRMVQHQERSFKPFAAVLHPGHIEAEVAALRPKFQERGIATLPSFDRIARAMARVTAYHRRRQERGE